MEPIQAAAAAPGQNYQTKKGIAVTYVGPSSGGKHNVKNAAGRLIEIPGDYVLFPVEGSAASAATLADLAGAPREKLEAAIPGLSDSDLLALADSDTRMWVLHAIGQEQEKRSTDAPRAVLPFVQPAAADAAILARAVASVAPSVAAVLSADVAAEAVVALADPEPVVVERLAELVPVEAIPTPSVRAKAPRKAKAPIIVSLDPPQLDSALGSVSLAAVAETLVVRYRQEGRDAWHAGEPCVQPAGTTRDWLEGWYEQRDRWQNQPLPERIAGAPTIDLALMAIAGCCNDDLLAEAYHLECVATNPGGFAGRGRVLSAIEARRVGLREPAPVAPEPETLVLSGRLVEIPATEELFAPDARSSAFMAGRAAYLDGEEISAIPVSYTNGDADEWVTGWHDGEALAADPMVVVSTPAPAPDSSSEGPGTRRYLIEQFFAGWLVGKYGPRAFAAEEQVGLLAALVGSVRENTEALAGCYDPDLIDAALTWEQAHDGRETVVRRLRDRQGKIASGTARPRRPQPGRLETAGAGAGSASAPAPAPVVVESPQVATPTFSAGVIIPPAVAPDHPVLSASGQARAAAIQQQLRRLADAVPTLIAAQEAIAALHGVGIALDLVALAGHPTHAGQVEA